MTLEPRAVQEALQAAHRLLPMETPHHKRDPLGTIDNYCGDGDFISTVREMLTWDDVQTWDDDRLHSFLMDSSHTDRYLDVIRVHDCIRQLSRDQLSEMLMQHSLCPIHHVDWAICFDDLEPGCEQIRFCFPTGHDT